jgi:hypothetical protein
MPILYGAVSYRRPIKPENEHEINACELSQPVPTLLHCAQCPGVEYGLIVEVDSSQADIEDYIGRVRITMEHGCPNHSQRIRIDKPRL